MIERFDQPLELETLLGVAAERPGTAVLDSAARSRHLGRYTIVAVEPFLRAWVDADGALAVSDGAETKRFGGDPLDALRELMARYETPGDERTPFAGGAIGYFAYDFCQRTEPVVLRKRDEAAGPEASFAFYGGSIAYDHRDGTVVLAASGAGDGQRALIASLRDICAAAARRPSSPTPEGPFCDALEPRVERAAYVRSVEAIRERIREGDVYQVNLSHPFDGRLSEGTAFDLFLAARRRNAAPYAAFLDFPEARVVSMSPEQFLRKRGGRVQTRPIKGTRPRGGTPAEEAAAEEALRGSAKDRAELLMIVDLERNDLGKIALPGSVRVDSLFNMEPFESVVHQTASVSAQLAPGRDVFDALRALFPGGSITGAPKLAAIRLIDALEPVRRRVYTGAIGYLGFDGDAEFNIAIRTLTERDGRLRYHVGGGIVWDSEPEAEYEETLDKGRAIRAILLGDARA